jgi:GMP synthase (glutamine-hydrolysing)
MSILIIDYGGPTVYKIHEILAELGTTSILIKPDHASHPEDIKGIILSGGPDHVYHDDSRQLPKWIDQVNVPILGICYGMQLICKYLKAKVIPQSEIEYGHTLIRSIEKDVLLGEFTEDIVWMNHHDTVVDIPKDLTVTSFSENGYVASVTNGKWWGVQMHPENTIGTNVFRNFLMICG